MSSNPHRIDSIIKDDGNGNPAFAASYTVTAYGLGARATGGSAATTAFVKSDHGFRVNDYLMVGTDTSKVEKVITLPSATTLGLDGNLVIDAGDLLVNLGTDSMSGGTPDYDGSPVTITNSLNVAISDSTVTANAQGVYEYFYNGANLWELIRDADGAPAKVIAGIHDNTGGDRVAFTDQDATPSVYMGSNFQTANTDTGVGDGKTTITMFDGGYTNQIITVHIDDAFTTIDFTGTNLKGNGGADWEPSDGSYLTAWFDGTDWICTVVDVEGTEL